MTKALPPGPKSTMFGLRNVWRFSTRTLDFLTEMKTEHGDLVGMTLLDRPWFMLNHPDDIETALVKHSKIMVRDRYVEILKRTLGLGLLTNEGDSWKRQRKLMAHAFTPKRIHSYGAAMASVGDRSVKGFRDGQEINIHQEMSRVTMEVVAEVLFGASIGENEINTVRDAMEVINSFYANSVEAVLMVPEWAPTPRNRRLLKAVKEIDALLYQIIARRRRGERAGRSAGYAARCSGRRRCGDERSAAA